LSRVGHAPSTPQRLTRAEWIAVSKRTFKRFLADDCMGLSQQVAYSALLAFFPAVVALVGLLDLIGAYDALQRFLNPVAPKAVTDLIQTFQQDSNGGGSAIAFVVGLLGAVWAASGAMGSILKAVNRAYERTETRPFWKLRLISILLVTATGVATAGMLLLVVLGGTLGMRSRPGRTSAACSRGSGTSPAGRSPSRPSCSSSGSSTTSPRTSTTADGAG